jgi:replicative DNA helicase
MTALPAAPRPMPTLTDALVAPTLGDERNEQQLLGTIIVQGAMDRTNGAFKQIAHFKEHYFVGKAHRIIFRAMTKVYEDNQNVEYDSVLDRLKKMEHKQIPGRYAIDEVSEPVLQQLCAVDGGNAELLIEFVIKAWVRRNEDDAADRVKKWSRDGNLTHAQFLEKIANQSTENMLQYTLLLGSQAQTMQEGMNELATELAKDRTTPSKSGYMWHSGIQELTDHMGGGLEEGLLYVFGGRPGDGKSIMLQGLATAVMNQGGSPFMISLEMMPEKFWQRMLVAESGIELDRIKSGNIDKQERAHLAECLKRLQTHRMSEHFRIEYMRMPTLAQMRVKIAQENAKRKINLFLLDYASFRKVTPANDKQPPNIQQGNISQWLVSIAKEFSIPVASAAQMSRDIEKRGGPPVMSDLEQSIAMEQDADFVCLFKDDDVKMSDVDYTVTNGHVVKSRNGKEGVVPMRARKHLFKFEDMWA